jgi:hypothetical protein
MNSYHLSELVRLCLHPKLAVAQGLIQREGHYTRELLHRLGTCDCCSAHSYDLAKAFLRETEGLSEVFQFTSGHYGRQIGRLNLLDFADRFLLRVRETAGFIRLKQVFQR